MTPINKPEGQGEEDEADSFVLKDIAGFLAPRSEALSSDFLELASYLSSEGYKDAAVVITGGVLEGHLRRSSEKLEIAAMAENGLPKQADTLNRELAARGAYSKVDQKNVTAWLNLRNYAVRGEYDRYARDDASVLLKGVRALLGRYPA